MLQYYWQKLYLKIQPPHHPFVDPLFSVYSNTNELINNPYVSESMNKKQNVFILFYCESSFYFPTPIDAQRRMGRLSFFHCTLFPSVVKLIHYPIRFVIQLTHYCNSTFNEINPCIALHTS